MLGSACVRAFGRETVGCDLDDFDIADGSATRTAVARLQPRLIVNCAAATDVDRCELDHEYADRANALGPKNLAQAAAEVGTRLVHVSTDFVFAGDRGRPYVETDTPGPVNHYGRSKLEGERGVLAAWSDALIVRTSWLYGHGGKHFPGNVIKWAAGGGPLRIVDDQMGSPTYAEDLAAGIRALTERGAVGIFHLGGTGCASRFEWAVETATEAGLGVQVFPASSSEFPLPAPRPTNTCLDCSKAAGLGVQLPPWRDGLARYIRSRQGAC
jgi:dTDP-4-dehydrorhamnose reductase